MISIYTGKVVDVNNDRRNPERKVQVETDFFYNMYSCHNYYIII